ncbi:MULTISPECIES: RNA 2'-phosphotransferase [unclassified Bradyrhizobium]|uniref:RNA 2'-phosphotransferase n=1 Tax=unclassified Bradyrhizobium TaxID=2631580 RepID=UPI0028E56AC5|nr:MULTISPECIES: RNA 2'-phosphotransferase [unclassified Bradyrhizobium]
MASDPVRLSKFLSLVLRHQPETIGLALDAQGWVVIDDLIARAAAAGTAFSRADLEHVVATSDKKRFTVSEDGQRIRAAQGHSVAVELGLTPREPPAVLYHGTATRFVESIMAQGLKPQSRQQVHLSLDHATAVNVGRRHGKPIVLRVDAAAMHRAGLRFYVADNGVWLTDVVPPEFLTTAAAP